MKREVLDRIYNSRKNLLVTGDMAVGKTANVLFPLVDDVINKEESLLILDPREEYINKYYNLLKKNNYNVIILNLKDLDKGDSWNPLSYPYNLYKKQEKDKALDYIKSITKEIFGNNANNSDPFWELSVSDLFIGTTLGLFEDGKEEEINLKSIDFMINGFNVRFGGKNYLANYFENKDKKSLAYTYAIGTVSSEGNTKLDIFATFKQRLGAYVFNEKLNMWSSRTTFNFDDILNKKTAIFVIGHNENQYSNSLVPIFIDQLFTILFQEKKSNKFNFILDNLDDIDYIINFLEKLSSGPYKNIKFIIGTRSLECLYDKYSKYLSSLCNIIYVNNKMIKIDIDGYEKKMVNEYKNNIINNEIIEYPKLDLKPVKYFDLKSFIHEIHIRRLPDVIASSNDIIDKKFNATELIKQIDKKIEELDKKKLGMKNNNK